DFALGAGFDGGGSGDTHVVQHGETLWSIARRVYGDPTAYTKIAAANGISDPNTIVYGQRLILPGTAGPAASSPIVVEPVGHDDGAESTSPSVAAPAPPPPVDGAGASSPIVVEPVGRDSGNGSADHPATSAPEPSSTANAVSSSSPAA